MLKLWRWFLGSEDADFGLNAFSFLSDAESKSVTLALRWLRLSALTLAVAVVLTAAPLFWLWQGNLQARAEQQSWQARSADPVALDAAALARNARLQSLRQLYYQNEDYLRSLDILLRAFNADISLSSFEQSSSGQVLVVGAAANQAAALALVARIESEVSAARLSSLRQQDTAFEFSLEFEL